MRGSMAGLLTAGFVVVAVAAGFTQVRAFPLNHDAAWYLYVAGAWLDGKRLYVDILEVSPPVIVWLSAPAVALARLAGTSVGITFRAWIFALGLGSLAFGLPALRRLEPDRRGLLLLLALLTAALHVLPLYDFGQREHLLVVLALPYLLARLVGGDELPRGYGYAVGLAAGVGLALKPHFCLVWVVCEAFAAAVGLTRRSDYRLVLAAGLGLGWMWALVLALTPDYLPFLIRIAPLYAACSIAPWRNLLARPEVMLVAMALAASAWASAAARRSAFVAAAFLAEAVASRKGWPYHYYPASAFAVLSLGIAGQVRPSLRLAWGGALAIIVATLALAWPSADVPRAVIDRSEILRAVDDTREPGPIAVLSPFFSSAWPMVLESGRPWAGRYPAANFLLTPEPTEPGSALFEEMITDVQRAQPAILIIDRRISELAPGRGEIGELGLRDKYESRGTVGPLKIYRRVD